MMNWVEQLFCKHTWEWFRNIYGDEIIACGYKRSIWVCTKCNKAQFRENLVQP